MRRRLATLRLVHPFPSALNALLVVGLGLLAGGAPATVAALGLAMVLLQFSIGAANDYFDADLDARTKPGKPIAAGLVDRKTAAIVASLCGVLALAVAALVGPLELLLAGAMLGAGLAYDAWLKPTAWGWLAFALAFPLLPVYAWLGASGELPPRPELLLPVAALAGPALQLANGLVDIEADRRAGIVTLPVRLGRRLSLAAMAGLLVVIHGLAWLTLVLGGPATAGGLALAGASGLAAVGLALSASAAVARRENGWRAQALSICLLAVGWLAGVLADPIRLG